MRRLFDYFAATFSFGLAIDEQIARGESPGQLDDVRRQARQHIELARNAARGAGKKPAATDSAAFAVVAWLDELLARHPPWRGRAGPLQMQLFNTHHAGEEFFELLSNLGSDEGEVREVYYHALLLGFAGQYYFDVSEQGELGRIKEFLGRLLPVAPLSLQKLREEGITPQAYETEDLPALRYPTSWDAWRMKLGTGVRQWHARRQDDNHSAEAMVESGALARMSAAIRYAKHALTQVPDMAGEQQLLYRMPWLLFLGDGDANVAGVLRAAGTASSTPEPSEDVASSIWRWWLLPSMVAIETIPRFACKHAGQAGRALWHQALIQLAHERERLPLNGIVVCVGVQSLGGEPGTAKETGARLRRLMDECMQELQIELPVYVVVTGLEQLPGFAALSDALPVEAQLQAIGWRLPEHPQPQAASATAFHQLYADMIERLHALRLTLLAGAWQPEGRRGVFEFVQSLHRLQSGLHPFIGALLEVDEQRHTPHWRGLYMVSGADENYRNGSFVADLFSRFLPADQPLAMPNVHLARHRY